MAVEYVDEASNEVELLCAVLSHWEPVNNMAPMPSAPPALRPYHAQQLHDMGVRVHPELAKKFKFRGPSGPVFTDDPSKKPDSSGVEDRALRILRGLSPEQADELASLSEAEKVERMAQMQDEAIASLQKLMKDMQ